jgi:hypothetical protein
MADNYTQFSFSITLGSEKEATWLGDLLLLAAEDEITEEQENTLLKVFPNWFENQSLGFGWEVIRPEGGIALWLTDDGTGDVDAVGDLVTAYLKEFAPEFYVSFEWATVCSKPRLNEFGGGAAVITAECTQWMNTWDWRRETCEEVGKELKQQANDTAQAGEDF